MDGSQSGGDLTRLPDSIFDEVCAAVDGEIDVAAVIGRHPEHRRAIEQHLLAAERLKQHWDSRADRAASAPELGMPERIGRFRLVRRLGVGGMGVVYLARDEELERDVALKLISPVHTPSAALLERFAREARSASRLDHPNICKVHEIGEHAGRPFIVMQFVAGETLRERILRARHGQPVLGGTRVEAAIAASGDERPALPSRREVDALVGVFCDLAAALGHAHDAGLVHRDIKPDNVILTPEGRPVILDFGLVRDDHSDELSLTRSVAVGTPSYMAPEQLRPRAQGVDHRADVFALGATLYECVTLQRAFDDDVTHRDEPMPPRRLNPIVPRELEWVLAKSMETSPQRRYASAAAFAADLRCVRENRPVAAKRTGVGTRVRKWVRRNPAATVVLGVLSVALLVSWVSIAGRQAALSREDLAREQTKITLARSQMMRGRWDEALQTLASVGAHADAVEQSLLVVEAKDGLLRRSEARARLQRIGELAPTDRHFARLRFWQAELAESSGGGRRQARDLYEQALAVEGDHALPRADAHYARAMLAGKLSELLDSVDKAIEAEPFHRQALQLRTVAVYAAGRTEQAAEYAIRLHQTFPADPIARIVLAACGRGPAAVRSDPLAAHVLALLDQVRIVDDHLINSVIGDDVDVAAALRSIGGLIPRFMLVLATAGGESFAQDLESFRQPELFRLAYLPILRLMPLAPFLPPEELQRRKFETWSESLERFPDGLLFTMRGMWWKALGEAEKALADARAAGATPSALGSRSRLLFCIDRHVAACRSTPPITDVDEARAIAARATGELLALGEHSDEVYAFLYGRMVDLDDPELAVDVAQAWVRTHPDDAARAARRAAARRIK